MTSPPRGAAIGWNGRALSNPRGRDITEGLEGLPDDMCQFPTCRLVLKDTVHLRRSDGTSEVINAGEAFSKQILLEEFCRADKVPHITLSVNMFDTGSDPPEAAIRKVAYSRIELW